MCVRELVKERERERERERENNVSITKYISPLFPYSPVVFIMNSKSISMI